MKRNFSILIICLLAFTQLAKAQEPKIPASSSSQRIEQDFALGHITLDYSRPNVKGRKIFGYMEPYGLVWRTGANSATIFKITDTIMMEGHQVLPGEYGLFSIPGTTKWTIILNKVSKQWGAYTYDKKQDVLRFDVKAIHLPNKVETLTFQFNNVDIESCDMQMTWENTGFNIHLKTNVNARVVSNIETLLKGEKKPYYTAAVWYYNHNYKLADALGFMKEMDKQQPNAYNIKYWLGRISVKMGNKAEGIAYAKEGLKLAKAEPNAEYIRMNKEVLQSAGVKTTK